MDPRTVLESAAQRQGWRQDTMLAVVYQYVENQQADDAFEDYVFQLLQAEDAERFICERWYEDDGIRVAWSYHGEGHCGDYDPDDPEDEQLLRFDVQLRKDVFVPAPWDSVSEDDDWFQPQDASFCTQLPVDSPVPWLEAGLIVIWEEVDRNGCGKNLERLSWMGSDWFEEVEDDKSDDG